MSLAYPIAINAATQQFAPLVPQLIISILKNNALSSPIFVHLGCMNLTAIALISAHRATLAIP